uniref:Transposase Tnp1/En/Spm-like domain-containing protein n=1 Tax=Zea mays TaxID=4577 RepID=A0A804UDS4_MAIZE
MSWSSRVSLTGSRTWTTGMTVGRTSPTTTGGGLRPRESTREKGMGVQYEAATIGLLSSSSSSPIRQAPAIPRSSYRAQPAAIAPGAAIAPDDAGCPPGSRYAAARRAPSSLLSPPYALQDPVEMPRGRRKQTVESNEEYLSEDHVGQKKLQKTLAHESDTEMEEESFAVGGHDQSGEVSEMEPNSKNPTDMDADIEVEDEETNVEVKRRGKTKLLQVWNIPRGHRIVVQCNELDQPIGEEAGIMGKFLGMVARNGNLCSLSYKDWRLLIGKKERLTNEQKNKEDILKQVKDISMANTNNRGKKKTTHTAGTKSFARTREDLREKDPEKKYPHRAILYIHTHKANPTKNTNPHVNDLQELLAEHPEFADTSQGKIAWNGDALNKILGEEKPGHVHGLGLVPNPNKVLDGTTSRRLNQLHVTSLDPTASEDVLSLKLQMEKLVNHVHKQDATIQELQQKSVLFEQHQSVHVKLLNSISQSVHTVGLCVTSNPFGYLFAMTGMFRRSSSESISNVFKT